MNHWLELRGTVWVMCDGIGCQPASDAEIEMWQELAKLRAELDLCCELKREYQAREASAVDDANKLRAECEGLRADAMRLDWFQTLTPHKLARIRAAFMPDSAGDVRATIDAARAGNGGGV